MKKQLFFSILISVIFSGFIYAQPPAGGSGQTPFPWQSQYRAKPSGSHTPFLGDQCYCLTAAHVQDGEQKPNSESEIGELITTICIIFYIGSILVSGK